jgi:hypothetical protein
MIVLKLLVDRGVKSKGREEAYENNVGCLS